jgi:sRNA-binding carbon storage regulator CsrA
MRKRLVLSRRSGQWIRVDVERDGLRESIDIQVLLRPESSKVVIIANECVRVRRSEILDDDERKTVGLCDDGNKD